MKLIIVESPTKAKTISKFLDKGYQVESSFGHIRDLPKSELGIDLENNFQPKYIIPIKARKRVSELKKLSKTAEEIILAPDEDREGEAIAWHLAAILDLDNDKVKRITFHEITKEAILEAVDKPRKIDQRMVDAQQARRVLDRLVGYKLSPFLWKKVAKGLSAGRVQSVAVRLIVEREREIKAFTPEEYWDINALLSKNKQEFSARLIKIKNKSLDKFYFKKEADVQEVLKLLEKGSWDLVNIETKEAQKKPQAPFITSTLQQTANSRLGFSAKQTMMTAQKLYERGYITYMRTDSFNLSDKFKNEAQAYIKKEWGDKYLSSSSFFKNKSKGAQEAHEAIRPSSLNKTPENLESKLDRNQFRLYQLIWQRALASQMSPAVLDTVSLDISAGEEKDFLFRANGQSLKFPGYLKVYPEKITENELPQLKKGESLDLIKLLPEQHFTQAPARYSDASLVKDLEKYGIGRPSTYAPTISTIIDRNYINRDEKKRLFPTDIAFVVVDLLVNHFPQIIDYKFTAEMEGDLDKIALGQKDWQPVINNFWEPFNKNLEKKYMELDKKNFSPEEESDELCDKCGASMIIKIGRYGKFLACSAFPECRNIKGLNNNANQEGAQEESEELKKAKEKYKDEKCDQCGAEMLVRSGRFGLFLGCSNYPKCRGIKNINQDKEGGVSPECPLCKKGKIIKKFSRRGAFYACSAYPECKNAYNNPPSGKKCKKCGSLMLKTKEGEKCSNKDCA